jgi:Tripartite tricarboxylate transporter family receptor
VLRLPIHASPVTYLFRFRGPPSSVRVSQLALALPEVRGLIGQPIIIENLVGADGSIGVGRAALARPDGYTIVLGILDTHVLNCYQRREFHLKPAV